MWQLLATRVEPAMETNSNIPVSGSCLFRIAPSVAAVVPPGGSVLLLI